VASGALQDATLPVAYDDLQSQLDAITTGGDVDTELARIKGEIAAAPGTPALDPVRATKAQQEAK
jgi:phage shock protein A